MDLPRLVQFALWPLSLLYGAIVNVRTQLYTKGWLKQKRLNAPVISVGNLTVGGTGKTPIVLWLAERFLAEGKRVAILSRGYRGANGTSDEIELLKHRLGNRAVFGVGPNRYKQGRRIEAQQAIDLFILDDGFQHLSLARNVDVLLVDASRGTEKEQLLPSGRLREPISAMSRADVLVFTRTEAQPGTADAIQRLNEYPIFAASTRLLGYHPLRSDISPLPPSEISAGPFFAFCGLGNPQAFFRDLETWGLPVRGHMIFADHHRYTDGDIQRLEHEAASVSAKAFVTTEKDAQNLMEVQFQRFPVYIAAIAFEIAAEKEFLTLIENKLRHSCGAAA